MFSNVISSFFRNPNLIRVLKPSGRKTILLVFHYICLKTTHFHLKTAFFE